MKEFLVAISSQSFLQWCRKSQLTVRCHRPLRCALGLTALRAADFLGRDPPAAPVDYECAIENPAISDVRGSLAGLASRRARVSELSVCPAPEEG